MAFDCIHGAWIPSTSVANYGYCRCHQGWSGPRENSGYCVYGSQNFIDLYTWNYTCDRACHWTFTGANPNAPSPEILLEVVKQFTKHGLLPHLRSPHPNMKGLK